MPFFHALEGIAVLLFIVALGWLFARQGWVSEDLRHLLPKFITCVALPPFLMLNIVRTLERERLVHMLYGGLIPLGMICAVFALAWVTGKIVGVEKKHAGLFCVCVSSSNTIFVGVPFNLAIFGSDSLPYVMLYYAASTTFLWTVGIQAIAADGGFRHDGVAQILARIFSPPMLGFLAGIAILLSGIEPPRLVMEIADQLGSMTTPLALLYVGTTLQGMELRDISPNRDIVLAITGRLVLSPLLMLAVVRFFSLPELMGKVFVIQSALPVLMQAAILSGHFRTDPRYAALMVSLSTVLSALTLPLWVLALS